MTSTTDTRPGNALLAHLAPNATVFVSSACIMVVELVAGRLISRFLGQSLYTWTAIIGVVLAGISLGNYLGGRLADRRWGRGTLALQLFAAAGGCVSVLALNAWIGHWEFSRQWPWAWRIFTHVTLVFLAPSVLLGTISPVIAKRALERGLATGRTIGNVYAWAIAGSILGTFLTGFYLLALLGSTAVLMASSGVLALLGAAYGIGALVTSRRPEGRPCAGSETGPHAVSQALPGYHLFEILATVFLANACIMIVELAAGRLAARYYGQSLYTWTTVIGVVLAGMSCGGYVGGRLADRLDPNRLLGTLFVLASITCLAIPPINQALVYSQVLLGLSRPMEILLHLTLAFGLPSLMVGAVTPALAKVALRRPGVEGRIVGGIYAWGSVGSIAGTFLAGFYLLAAAGTLLSLRLVAGALALLGVAHGRHMKLSYTWAAICALGLVVSVLPWTGSLELFRNGWMQDAAPGQAVYVDESQYSYIRVIAKRDQPNIRRLKLDKLTHSEVDLDDPLDLRYEYARVYDAVLQACFPAKNELSVMVIGGGGYVFPRYLELTRPGSYIEASEIDPAVTEAAHAAFGLPRDTSIRIFNTDARNRVHDLLREKRAGKSVPAFDAILGDSCNDYTVPFHLTSLEFNEELKELLKADGVYILNMIDMLDSARFLGAVVNTCRETFTHVYVLNCDDTTRDRDTFVVVSAMRPLDLTGVPARIRVKYAYTGVLLDAPRLDALVAQAGAPILTDDFAPVENMLAPVVRESQDVRVFLLAESAGELLLAGKHDAAIRKCRRALRVWPKSADAHEIMGIALVGRGDLAAGIEALRQCLALEPERVSAHTHLARALFNSGDFAGAATAWREAAEINPNEPDTYENLGAALIHQGQPGQAVSVLNRALALRPQSASAHNNLAVALYQGGDIKGAVREMKAVLEIDPDFAGVYPQLAVAYWKLRDYDNAWKTVEKAGARGEAVDPGFLEALGRDSGRTP